MLVRRKVYWEEMSLPLPLGAVSVDMPISLVEQFGNRDSCSLDLFRI